MNWRKLLLALVMGLGLIFGGVEKAKADNDSDLIPICNISVNETPLSIDVGSAPTISSAGVENNQDIFNIQACGNLSQATSLLEQGNSVVAAIQYHGNIGWEPDVVLSLNNNCLVGTFYQSGLTSPHTYTFDIEANDGSRTPICRRAYANLSGDSPEETEEWDTAIQQMCSSFSYNHSPSNEPLTSNSTIGVSFNFPDFLHSHTDPLGQSAVFSYVIRSRGVDGSTNQPGRTLTDNLSSYLLTINPNELPPGYYEATIRSTDVNNRTFQEHCVLPIEILFPDGEQPDDPGSGNSESSPYNLCAQIADADQKAKCQQCQATDPNSGTATAIWTAIGCVPTDVNGMLEVFITLGVSLAGGVAILVILAGAFMLSISQGEPKRASDAREMITAAIIGLLFIVFSITILQFIGVDILQIPGFGT